MLEDNIVLSDNSKKDHKWHMEFDDVNNNSISRKKKTIN